MQSTDPQHVQVVNSVLCTHIWSPIQPCTYNNVHTANKYHTHVAQSSASPLTVHFVIDYGEITKLNSGSSNVFMTLITIHIIDYPFAKSIISIVIFLFEERSFSTNTDLREFMWQILWLRCSCGLCHAKAVCLTKLRVVGRYGANYSRVDIFFFNFWIIHVLQTCENCEHCHFFQHHQKMI